MTDEELIARLLDWEEYDEGDINDAREAAANRIKELKAELAGGNLPVKFVRADLYEAQAAEIERLREALQWCSGSADFNEGGIAREGWLKLCAPLLTGSTTVKDSLTPEDEKQSHEWKCPIDYPGCRKNCGSQYGCKN